MWKRLQGHGREKEKHIGNPVLVETTYDEDQLRHIPTISAAQNASHQPSVQSPSSLQSYNTLSPTYAQNYRASDAPTLNSTYSQPSPELNYDYNPTASEPGYRDDVSPPSSPEPEQQNEVDANQPRRFRSMRDVSPVDETRAARTGSNIPVLRKAPLDAQGNQTAATQKFWGGKVAPNSKVKWDEYSGEPTSSTKGKASQVSPGSFVPKVAKATTSGPQDALKKPATYSERTNRFGSKPSVVDTKPRPREPWSRASGRAEIVQPLKDDKDAKQPPTAFQKRVVPKKADSPGLVSPNSLANTVKRVPVATETAPVADDREGLDSFDTHEDPIKPVVPLKVGRNSPPRSLASPTSPHNPVNQGPYSYPSPITPTNNQPRSQSTKEQETEGPQSRSTPPNAKIVRKSIEATPESTSSKENGFKSRFSWTTVNTSTTYQHSPPPSPPPPLPTEDPLPAAKSILERKRPVPTSDKATARKPISAATTRSVTMSDPPSPRPSSTFSTNTQKALPRPPTELTAADHIDILEAQMEDLRLRRSNVGRLLHDLNQRAPPNPLLTDFKRMRLVERRKKDFENELAEIKKEEHDVGLMLHRAWRKRERADPNGSESAIWIRRVTR
ncbi:hypothetical protein EJ04DRAFT_523131 [Polyplosphaeria fusca]|uniref:Uncharacterized protein n=1 Tax=Polyplosphaeria fusca TaxID=682080 RepID=A0A9P4V3C2_9PLEO|nr:hypothetical protein EJ04DRAFT_523131 [Polyplosphaeria fusca]